MPAKPDLSKKPLPFFPKSKGGPSSSKRILTAVISGFPRILESKTCHRKKSPATVIKASRLLYYTRLAVISGSLRGAPSASYGYSVITGISFIFLRNILIQH